MARLLRFAVLSLATAISLSVLAKNSFDPHFERKDLAGIWVGGPGDSEFLRAEFDADGHGTVVGIIDEEKVNFIVGDIDVNAMGWIGTLKDVNGSRDMKVTASAIDSSMFITVKDGQVNWRREFSLRRIDALRADIDSAEKQAAALKSKIGQR